MSNTKNQWHIGETDEHWIEILATEERSDDIDPTWTVAKVNKCMGRESRDHARLIVASPLLLAEAFQLVARLKEMAIHPSHFAGLEAAVAKAIEG